MAGRSEQRGTKDSSETKLMSDMDPDGMDSELEGEGDLDAPENISRSASEREQQANQVNPIRTRRVAEPEEGENEDEEDVDIEPRSTPRPAPSVERRR
jgi:hypothetical protein